MITKNLLKSYKNIITICNQKEIIFKGNLFELCEYLKIKVRYIKKLKKCQIIFKRFDYKISKFSYIFNLAEDIIKIFEMYCLANKFTKIKIKTKYN